MRCLRKYYDVLNLPIHATHDDVRKAYLRLALKWHPDKNLDNMDQADKKFKEICEAYDVLSNGEKRASYDATREFAAKAPSLSPKRCPREVFREFLGQYYVDLFNKQCFNPCSSTCTGCLGRGHHRSASCAGNENQSLRPHNAECITFTASRLLDGTITITRKLIQKGNETIEIIENGKLVSRSINGILQTINS